MAKFKQGDILYSKKYNDYCKIVRVKNAVLTYFVKGALSLEGIKDESSQFQFTQIFVEQFYDYLPANIIDVWEELNNEKPG